MKTTTSLILSACFAAPALAGNFSYTSLEAGLGVRFLDDSLIHAEEVYDEFGALMLAGALQLDADFLLGAELWVAANSGPDTEIAQSRLGLRAGFPLALSGVLDIVPMLGVLASRVEYCQYSWCYRDIEGGLSYGLELRFWALPGTVELTAAVTDSTLPSSRPLWAAGAAIWRGAHHIVRLQLRRYGQADDGARHSHGLGRDGNEILFGYRYSW